MWIGYDGVGTMAASPGASMTHIRWDSPSLAPMVVRISVSGSSSTPKRRRYRSETAERSLGMPLLDEYRWFLGLGAASLSFSPARSGEGMSGLPKPRSMTSSPARRAATLSPSMMVKTYGGSELIRRNSISGGYRLVTSVLLISGLRPPRPRGRAPRRRHPRRSGRTPPRWRRRRQGRAGGR